ncbi:hypothetical protein [Pedobacter sp.]|uniref:hypothetical protein n=1 Tax=Pedobacter sp. TaxID=1411316 RepID=UPI0031E3A3C2
MNRVTQIIKNSAFSLIVLCTLSIIARLIFSFIDYNNGSISFTVKRVGGVTEEIINGIHFTTVGIGKIEIKPTFVQSFVLNEHIYKDGGATMLFYLISGFTMLWWIKHREIKLEDITEKKIAKLLWIGFTFFIVPKILFKIFLDHYVANLTNNKFDYYDNSSLFDNCIYLAIILFNVVYGFIEYTKKLKQDVDLTI